MPRFALLMVLCGLAFPANAQDLVAGAPALELTAPAVESAPAAEAPADLAVFSRELRRALHSDNVGVRMDALRQLAHYGEQVSIDGPTVLYVTRLFRDSKDVQVRLLALRALDASGDAWAADFIRRSVPTERDPRVRRALEGIVAEAN